MSNCRILAGGFEGLLTRMTVYVANRMGRQEGSAVKRTHNERERERYEVVRRTDTFSLPSI
jgi:hypothetical protein